MSIKSSYPTKINGTDVFAPDSWTVTPAVVETEFQTEAGTDEVIVTRYDKVTISAKYTASAKWLKLFQGWATTASLTVKYYDPISEGYSTRTMRMRNFKYVLIQGSDALTTSLGLYTVSFDLIEF